ncbi:MAG: hypothetical protein RSA20_05455 [Oscillospiraceae bacterium]
MAKTYKTTVYDKLGGVDFSRSPSLVSKSRSPYCVNMIGDSGKNPVKRSGWQTVYSLGAPMPVPRAAAFLPETRTRIIFTS